MRERDLTGLALVLAIVIVYGCIYGLPMIGVGVPSLLAALSSRLIGSFILFPILMAILYPINRKIKALRKARGRDIDEEERYETKDGLIKLTPND